MNSNMVKPKKNDHLHSVDNFTVALKLQRVPRKHFQFSINIFVVSYRYIRFLGKLFFFSFVLFCMCAVLTDSVRCPNESAGC